MAQQSRLARPLRLYFWCGSQFHPVMVGSNSEPHCHISPYPNARRRRRGEKNGFMTSKAWCQVYIHDTDYYREAECKTRPSGRGNTAHPGEVCSCSEELCWRPPGKLRIRESTIGFRYTLPVRITPPLTYSSNNGCSANQIGYMLLRFHWAFSVTDCRA